MPSPAITGALYSACASFPMAVPTGTGCTGTSLARGSYYVYATVDTWMKLGASDVVATVPSTRSPGGAAQALNSIVFVPAYQIVPFDTDGSATHFSLIGATAGTITFTGPVLGK